MRRVLAAAALLSLGATTAGCVSLPEQGPVRSVTVQDAGEADTLVDYTPAGPQPGSSPTALVDGFLTSMTATPLDTSVARRFLAAGKSRSWVPDLGTVVYGSQQLVGGPGGQVTLLLRDVVELDSRGSWLGDPTAGRGHDYRLRLVQEQGGWRISNPPDRLLIPQAHFDRQYQQHLLYFLDQGLEVLVPEPVYVPRGSLAPTVLVTGLLRGPLASLRDVERTAFPDGTAVDGGAVRVSRDGTADVALTDQVRSVGRTRRNLLLAQLSWTLGQVPGIERVRVSVDGVALDVPGSGDAVSVDDWSAYDPSVTYASTDLFGIRDRRVVATGDGGDGPEDALSGAFGSLPLGLRSIGVDLLAQRIAGVSADGRVLLESDRDGDPGEPPSRDDIRVVFPQGTDLLRPAYDLYGQLWFLDRTGNGARVWVAGDDKPRAVSAPGLTGRSVTRFALSRDGTRLVAVVRRNGRDQVLLSRIERDGQGEVERIQRARRLDVVGLPTRIRDVAFRTSASVGVLVGSSASTSQVLTVRVDGSAVAELSTDLEPVQARSVRLVSSPTRGTPLYVATADGRLFTFSARGRWVPSEIEPGLVAATFVG